MKLKFGQDFEVEILFKLEFKKLGKMTQASCCWAGEPVKNYLAVFFSLRGVVWWGYPFALCINNPKYQPVSLYNSSFRNIQLSQLDLFSSSIYQNIQNSKMCYISNLICGTFISINMWGAISFGIFVINFSKKDLHSKVKNLNATQNGKSSEESHRATNKTKLAHKGYLFSKDYDLLEKHRFSKSPKLP